MSVHLQRVDGVSGGVQTRLQLNQTVAARVELLLDAFHRVEHGGNALRSAFQLLLNHVTLLALLFQLLSQYFGLFFALFFCRI